MLSLFKNINKISPNEQLIRLQEKVNITALDFSDKIQELEKHADTIYKDYKKSHDMLEKFKHTFHNVDNLISIRDRNSYLHFANYKMCTKLYGLPKQCSEIIDGRKEYDVINDYIEKTGKWNSFVEGIKFNLDKYVLKSGKPTKFIEIGYIDNEKIILDTIIKPHLLGDKIDGFITISNIISEEIFHSIKKSKKIYDENDYTVYLVD